MSTIRGAGSAVGAITQAAIGLGLPDPITMADHLVAVDVDALSEWFSVAGRIRVMLWQGADRLADAVPLLSAGWSRSEPRVAIGRQREAGLTARATVSRQFDAADNAAATLRQSRVLADAEVSSAESATLALGWTPGDDLLTWALQHQALDAVTGIIGGLQQRLTDLQDRNDEALQSLAAALRTDPGESVDALLSTVAAAAGQLPAHGLPGLQTPAASAAGVDAANLTRLATDLQSADVSTRAMANGVRAALLQAELDGGVGQLLVYESASSTSQGRAAISVGDLTTADNVAIFAPGVSNAPVTMIEGIASATAIRNAAHRQSPDDRTAVVSWYGYDIPLSALGGVPVTPWTAAVNVASAINDTTARAGGSLLVRDLAQFRHAAPDTARFIGMGFSLGSTTVSAAAARGAGFDDLVLMGSPGASNDVQTADDYPEMTAQHVHVLSYDNDPVTQPTTDFLASLGQVVPLFSAPAGPFGPDPADQDFGAQNIDASSNNPDISVAISGAPMGGLFADVVTTAAAQDLTDLQLHHQEGNYLSGPSLVAVAAVVTGRYGEVPVKPGR